MSSSLVAFLSAARSGMVTRGHTHTPSTVQSVLRSIFQDWPFKIVADPSNKSLSYLLMCLGSDRPDGQTVHPWAELHGGFDLIPVSGVGEAAGGVSEAVRDDKQEETGSEGQ